MLKYEIPLENTSFCMYCCLSHYRVYLWVPINNASSHLAPLSKEVCLVVPWFTISIITLRFDAVKTFKKYFYCVYKDHTDSY